MKCGAKNWTQDENIIGKKLNNIDRKTLTTRAVEHGREYVSCCGKQPARRNEKTCTKKLDPLLSVVAHDREDAQARIGRNALFGPNIVSAVRGLAAQIGRCRDVRAPIVHVTEHSVN